MPAVTGPAIFGALVAAEPVGDSTAVLLAYGPLGVFAVIAILAGRVIWKRFNELLTSATARAEAAEEKYDRLVERVMTMTDSVTPVVTRSTDATRDLLLELTDMRRDRR